MSGQHAATAVLNGLLESEAGSLLPRLADVALFADAASADKLAALHRIAADSREHVSWLSEAIVSLRGIPAPRLADASIADAHYVTVDSLLPRVIHACEALVSAYGDAAGRVLESPRSAEVIGRIQARHQEHLKTLREYLPTEA